MNYNRGLALLTLLALASIGALSLYLLRPSKLNHSGAQENRPGLIIESSPGAATVALPTSPAPSPTQNSLPQDQLQAPAGSSLFVRTAYSRGRPLHQICDPAEPVSAAILAQYGALYVSEPQLVLPSNCIPTRQELSEFSRRVVFENRTIDGIQVSFQRPALDAFMGAREAASARGLSIRPNGTNATLRDYETTVEIWQRNLQAGINVHGAAAGRQTELLSPDIRLSIAVVLDLEKSGLLLGSGGGKSILQVAAPPGTSQHISGLAVDIVEHEDAQVRQIMADNGFYQTIANDFTHFTYLGLKSDQLSAVGLAPREIEGRTFYVPVL
ncbi:MAG: D-alanyl-D-alanine carboxypeptidase family protein [Candidatus Obscuribacter sp.]|nr:D-alanyl-D-alanine carboxypeptidase family protein [Candidatus Obscuribacter sp.]